MLLLGIFFILNEGCYDEHQHEKYQRPDWLPGKLYTSVSKQENLSLFTECLQLTGLDTILNVSGVWTVFAPTDEAMQHFLFENHYAGISDIPPEELEKITKFHIVQNPWSLEQLQILSAYGWRKENDKNWDSFAYKRQTILKNPVEKYWIKSSNNKVRIVTDSLMSDGYRKVFVKSRKYVPIFYDEYIAMNGLTYDDYSFYFDRAYEPGNIYYAGAKILQANIFAENGFVHIIDKVVEPMLNANEILEMDYLSGESYKLFLEMVYWYYPNFEPNMNATFYQPEVRLGGIVDTLFDLNYTSPAFALQKEHIGVENSNVSETLVRHNGLYVPTDEAFGEFVNGILTKKSGFPHWPDYRSLPQDVCDIIFAPHFKSAPIYPSTNHYRQIFRKVGTLQLDEGDIIRKEFGSNCTFLGLKGYIPDQVFTSVTGPVFLRPEFSVFRRALQYANIDDDISRHNGELYFFAIPDYALKADSSLLLNWIDDDANLYNFREYNRTMMRMENLSRNAIRNRIMNHVGTLVPNGNTNITTIRTLRGNYITWDHIKNTIMGTRPSTIGYTGDVVVPNTPVPLEEPADNGKTFSVRYWIKF